MKKLFALLLALVMILSLTGCGGSYQCYGCDKKTSKAYYDMAASKEQVLCEDCALEYWMPLDYKNYRVK